MSIIPFSNQAQLRINTSPPPKKNTNHTLYFGKDFALGRQKTLSDNISFLGYPRVSSLWYFQFGIIWLFKNLSYWNKYKEIKWTWNTSKIHGYFIDNYDIKTCNIIHLKYYQMKQSCHPAIFFIVNRFSTALLFLFLKIYRNTCSAPIVCKSKQKCKV